MNTAAIEFDAIGGKSFRALSGAVAPGQVARVTYVVQEQCDELWDVLTGLRAPRRGRLRYTGTDVYALPPPRRLETMQHIGVLSSGGGLISNLKVWENVVLPTWYHRDAPLDTLEQPVAALLRELGVDDKDMRELMTRLPEQLHDGERTVVGLVRALLMQPDIMIYSAPFSGMERDMATRLLRVITDYQRGAGQRAALMLLPDEPFSQRVPADVTLTLEI